MPNGIELLIALLLGFVVLGGLLESVVEERR
jgi:Tfp pilus assembly protein PilW